MKFRLLIVCFFLQLTSTAKDFLVKNITELTNAVSQVKAGDVIILNNGVWRDVEISFEGTGTATKPIILRAKDKGKVMITGKSNLRISGQYLVVEGLVFKDGFSPTTDLIAFRKDTKSLANNCRLTACVIDNFNGPERHNVEAWVVLFGKNNRVDNCQFLNKRNNGVTLVVRLDSKESVENKHLIDHNYFGFRQNLGSNGGETIRIGVSQNSMMNSQSIVEYNYFDRCNGEQEIISNKSNQNTYRYNTFYECQGTLTMRHGNETLVEGNIMIGNGVANTGGIRVINEKQTVINNYCEGLTGERFRGALTVMNGVPNSPLNRYVPVKESKVLNNTFVDCANIELGAGNDKERSQAPQSTDIKNNVFFSSKNPQKFGVYADLSGISFEKNLLNKVTNAPSKSGFEVQELVLINKKNGTKELKENIGAKIITQVATKENTGVKWYPKLEAETQKSAKIWRVKPGLNTIFEAVSKSSVNDIILLAEGSYNLDKIITINHPIKIKSEKRSSLTFETMTLFQIENGGSLTIENLDIDGALAPDTPLNSVIATSKYSMNKNYSVIIENCTIKNLKVNHSFNFLRVSAGTFADSISIKNTQISSVSGAVIALDKELDDIGIYNAESILMENCSFQDIEGPVVSTYRGGTDESTIAGSLEINHCEFKNIGFGKKNTSNTAINLLGMQTTIIKNSVFDAFNSIKMTLTVGEPKAQIHHNIFSQKPNFIIQGAGFEEFKNTFEAKGSLDLMGDDTTKIGRK